MTYRQSCGTASKTLSDLRGCYAIYDIELPASLSRIYQRIVGVRQT
jgi:hypothetical protein